VGELIFFWWSVLTTIGSLCISLLGVVAFLGIGYEEPFLILLMFILLSTIGLVAGCVALLSHRRWARAVLLLSSIYMPATFFILTARGSSPPVAFLPFLLLGFIEIVLALLGPRLTFVEEDSD